MQPTIPAEIQNLISGEKLDFAVRAKRSQSVLTSFFLTIFGLCFVAFTGFFLLTFIDTSTSINNLSNSTIFAGIVVTIFFIIGLTLFIAGLRSFRTPGPWFVGTDKKLLVWTPKQAHSYDWEQFLNTTEVSGSNLSVTLRTGSMMHRKNAPDEYVPDTIDMLGIDNVQHIESMMRKRIAEHDPIPPQV